MSGPTGPITPARAGIFGAVCAAVIGIIVYGRVRPLETPRPARWAGPVSACVEPGVSPTAATQAIEWWHDRGYLIVQGCDGAQITIAADVTIDTRDSVDQLGTTHGLTAVHADGGLIRSAEVRVLPGSGALVIAHEIGHSLGYQHPRFAPSGVMMHPSRPGWDGRGLTGP